MCQDRKCKIFFINTNYQINKLLKPLIEKEVFDEVTCFNGSDVLDYALEWCENNLLAQLLNNDGAVHRTLLKDQVLLRGFSDVELDLLAAKMEMKSYEKGEIIVSEGEASSSLFFILEGDVSVTVHGSKKGGEQRIATLTAGRSFGEMTLIDHQHRSATITACNHVDCYELPFEVYDGDLKKGYGDLREKLLSNIIIDLSDKIRRLNREIKAYQ